MCFPIVIKLYQPHGRFDDFDGMLPLQFLRFSGLLWFPLVFNNVHEQPEADITKHQAHKQFEVFWVGQVLDADPCADKYTGQGADDHRLGRRPQHSPFPNVRIHATGYCHNVEDLVCAADRWRGVTQNAYLKRQ